ncbi:hypothetical protein ACFHWD_04105 [Clostridium sp. MT-14]|uniref:hypothetical protein n=1 Tax=Clostridium sp. MT-14 TaxID=3348360 RepID=UPI0035F43A75
MANSLQQLREQLISRAREVAQKDMTEKIKDVEIETIEKTVYDAYYPMMYERRMSNNGLIDRKNIDAQFTDNVNGISMYVTNNTRGNTKWIMGSTSGYIEHIIEEGIGYTWEYSDIYKQQPYPRPFTKNTINDLKQNKQYVQALKNGLKKSGIDVK